MTTENDQKALRLLVRHSGSKDAALAEDLLAHVRPLERFTGIDVWADDRLRAGDTTRKEVDAAIEEAGVVLLLLSADFLASNEILDVEVPQLLERHRAGGLRVIPVVLRSCAWEVHRWLVDLRPLPKGGNAIAGFTSSASGKPASPRNRSLRSVPRVASKTVQPTREVL